MTKKELIESFLMSLEDDDYITIHNSYCDVRKYPEDEIYCMDELDVLYSAVGKNPTEILDELELVNLKDNYLQWNDGIGYWESFNCYAACHCTFSVDEIADYCVDNNNDLRSLVIEEILELTDVCDCLSECTDEVTLKWKNESRNVDEWMEILDCHELDEIARHEYNDENGMEYVWLVSDSELEEIIY